MHDIFISYANKDKQIAKSIAEALEKEGFKVWWDIEIPAGSTFDAVIEKAVENAKCVIVLWSQYSVKSEWVHLEAAEGKKRNILIPILIDDVDIPFAFRRRQTADLRNWISGNSDASFNRLVSDIRTIFTTKEFPTNKDERLTEPEKFESIQKQTNKKEFDQEKVGKNRDQRYLRYGVILILLTATIFAISSIISSNTDSSNLKIGDDYAGGIIFQIDPDGYFVKICAKGDLGSYNWYDANTKCQEYTMGEYSDWYLPSKDELNLIYNKLSPMGLGNFKNDWYWSATDTEGKAWEQHFGDGNQQNDGGGNESFSSVRPIRSISLNTKKIGDKYAGGIIFQLDSDGQHGKVCSEFDLGSYNWSDAKTKCNDYTEGKYTDWYLPSKDELNLLYNSLSQMELSNFKNDWYWSSSETDGKAWEQHLGEGYQQNDGGGNESYSSVRAIRTF